MVYFGEYLKNCREQKGLSCKNLAKKLTIEVGRLKKLESDKLRPTYELICRLSKVLDIDKDELLKISTETSIMIDGQIALRDKNYNPKAWITVFSSVLFICVLINFATVLRLDWSLIVLSVLLILSVNIILPAYLKNYRLAIISLANLIALFILFAIICLLTRGNWFFVVATSLMVAYSAVILPIIFFVYFRLPKEYNFFICLIAVAITILLLVVSALLIS